MKTSVIPQTSLRNHPLSTFFACCLIAITSSEGAIGISKAFGTNGAATDFDASISNNDLINSGASTFSHRTTSPTSNPEHFNDGTQALGHILDEVDGNPSRFPATIDFHLDTSVNTLGYRLTSISTFSGIGPDGLGDPAWAGREHQLAHQSYTVSYSLVGDPLFTELTTVSAIADTGEYSAKISLIGLAANVPSGVDAVRFVWHDPIPALASSTHPDESHVAIREIDVFGSAVPVPEPSSAMLLALSLVAVLQRRSRS